MIYLGHGKYKIFLGNRFIELTESEIFYFLEDTQYFLENHLEDLGYVNIHHHPTEEILLKLKENCCEIDMIDNITSIFEDELMDNDYIQMSNLEQHEDNILDSYKEELNKQGYFKNKTTQKVSNSKENVTKNQRGYNSNKKIKQLFKQYYNEARTKKEVFIQISKELNISFKAVEKAFYLK